jgi:NAD(P)H-dependent FMN reductase
LAKIAIIVGSVRQNRQGIKVARWMEEKLNERGHTIYFIDPLELNLPLLDKMYKEIIDPTENLKQLRNQIVEADGYMPITPEYNHSTSAALNTLDSFLVILDIFYNYRQVI